MTIIFDDKEWTHQGYNLRVSTVEEKGKEGVEEDADKLDHLQSGQVPAHKSCDQVVLPC